MTAATAATAAMGQNYLTYGWFFRRGKHPGVLDSCPPFKAFFTMKMSQKVTHAVGLISLDLRRSFFREVTI